MNDTTNNAEAQAPVADPNALVALVKSTFHFKKEKMRDADGKVIGEGKKHPSVVMDLPVPTLRSLGEFLADTKTYAKELELLTNVMFDQVYRIARSQINDWREANKDGTVTAASLNYDKLAWSTIANMPKGERASTVPSDEDTKAFLDSYLQLMPEALNKPKQNIENHLLCFQTGFKKQRSQKEILEMFQNALLVYVTTAGEEAIDEHQEVIDYFSNRLKKLLETEEKITMDNL